MQADDRSGPAEDVRPRLTGVVVSHLGPLLNEAVAAHPSRPRVVVPDPSRPAWDLPEDTEVLLTTPPRWRSAPSERPAGWPRRLTWIQLESVGIDAYPKWLLEGPVVTSARGSNAASLAEFAMAEILGFAKRVHETVVRSPKDWRHVPLSSIEDRTLGIAGFGAVGAALAPRALAFGMKVLAFRRSPWAEVPPGVQPVESIGALFAGSDHLVLAMPQTPETRHIVGASELAMAKPGLHLVNIARGGLVDQDALLHALDGDRLARATLDVTTPEPLPKGHPFYTHPKVRLTPHLSWDGEGNFARMKAILLDNLERYAGGAPLLNAVDPARGY